MQAANPDDEDVVKKSDMVGCGVLGKRALDAGTETEGDASFQKVKFKKAKVACVIIVDERSAQKQYFHPKDGHASVLLALAIPQAFRKKASSDYS